MKEELRRILIHIEFLYGVSVETTEETINKIERLIDLAVAEERKRIIDIIWNMPLETVGDSAKTVTQILSLISKDK